MIGGQNVSLVGVSNVGKSWLLKDMCRPEVQAALRPQCCRDLRLFYVDCNAMLDWNEQAFYELVLRVVIEDLQGEGLAADLSDSYEALLNPTSDFHVPLSFNRALEQFAGQAGRRSIFVFDEFDAAFQHLNPRVFLNLRALKDRHNSALSYVAATDRRLSQIRSDEQADEFKELFGPNVHYLLPLELADAQTLIAQQAAELNATFDQNDIAFVMAQAGGHPVLTELACRGLAVLTGQQTRSDSEDWLIHREVRDILRSDPAVRSECDKIWRDLDGGEREVLRAMYAAGEPADLWAHDELLRKGMLRAEGDERRIFAELFADYVHHLSAARKGPKWGVYIDLETDAVFVDGLRSETLTNLEYRLLLMLYGHLNKICDKYEIVESVWGEEYIDEVYDASIEKLVSRLRRKIEPDPSNPQYLITVRGRGYKLAG